MYCPSCGTEITGQPRSCPDCGTELIAVSSQDGTGGRGPGGHSDQAHQEARGGTSVDRPPGGEDDTSRPENDTSRPENDTSRPENETRPPEVVHTAEGGGYLAAVSVGAGLLRGVGAFFSGFVLVGVVVGVEVITALQDAAASTGGSMERLVAVLGMGVAAGSAQLAGNAAVVLLKLVGWVFFAAHQVPVVQRGGTGGQAVNVLAEMGAQGGPLTPVFYYAIPPVLLTWVGLRVAIGAGALSPETGLVPGASIALGYVPIAFFGAQFVRLAAGASGSTVGPDPVSAALFAGLYAGLFGAFGGLLGGALNDADLASEVGP